MSGVSQFIGGIWRDGSSIDVMKVIDPASAGPIAQFVAASIDDVNAAVVSAAEGFKIWRDISPWERGRIIHRIADQIRASRDALALAITTEQGKPFAEGLAEADRSADFMEWGAVEARRVEGQVIPSRGGSVDQQRWRTPIGPTALFTPWNFPAVLIAKKLSAALAAGCSIVLKPSEETPSAAVILVECCLRAGLPPSTINLVIGDPVEISSALIPHREIRKISFTGSTAVGKHLASQAGAVMKSITMELGGHAPVIVADSVDIEQVVKYVASRKFSNAGQACISPTRFIVARKIYSTFVEALAAEADALTIGVGSVAGIQMGPLANDRRRTMIADLTRDATSRGARIATSRRAVPDEGFFFPPTVLAETPASARMMFIEPFGPVAPTMAFDTLDEAISLANALPYGLAAYAFSDSPREQHRLRTEIGAGMVGINTCPAHYPELPMGGWKDSGIGVEGGTDAIAAYQKSKLVCTVPDTKELVI